MALYLLVFLLSISINILANKYNYRKEIYLAISLLFLAVFVGISDMLGGYDRYIYSELFDGIADITRAEGSYTKAAIFYLYPSEFGYSGYLSLLYYSQQIYLYFVDYFCDLSAILFLYKKVLCQLPSCGHAVHGTYVFLHFYLFETNDWSRSSMVRATIYL